ncbi:MAG: diaminopimelate decarboxylase, partial [Anaerolineae bacterium]|nr:diaminopimelate decarboxylase [Anaerolineae bacterium]
MLQEIYHYENAALWIEGVSMADLAEAVGTPVYVYSQPHILRQLARLRAAFAPVDATFHYSLKANGNGHLIRLLVEAGCGCDVVSAGEVYMALRAGCPPEHVVFAGVGKTAAEIRYALERGIGWFNVENAGELARLNVLAGELGVSARAALRLNPALRANTHAHIATGHEGAKFGIPLPEARDLLAARADYPHVQIAGLHLHIGSQLGRPNESVQAAQRALALIHEFDLHHLNLGGGFPVTYDGPDVPPVETFAEALCPVLAEQGVDVSFEPGRFLIAGVGVLLAEVQYVKNGGKTVVLDAGMTDLLRPALYGARHPIWPLEQLAGTVEPTQVVGPICESSDVVHPAAALPPLEPGDRVAIGMA